MVVLLGWLWLGGILATFFKPWRGLLWFVVLPTALYLLSVFSVGDAVSRYLLPAEWSAYLLAAVAAMKRVIEAQAATIKQLEERGSSKRSSLNRNWASSRSIRARTTEA